MFYRFPLMVDGCIASGVAGMGQCHSLRGQSTPRWNLLSQVFNTLKEYEKEYVNLICNHTEFNKVKRYYLPDWVFLEGEDDTMEAAICSVIVEMVTGLRPEDNHGMFKAIVTGIEMDIDAEIGFPVLD